LKATPGSPIGSLTAADGTITAFNSYKTVPDGTFLWLWGADGNSLVVSRKGDDWGCLGQTYSPQTWLRSSCRQNTRFKRRNR
jgi:hypothetical protein